MTTDPDAVLVEFGEIETEDSREPTFDFTSPEDVLIEVVGPHDDKESNDWKNYSIETVSIIRSTEGVVGAASYDSEYGAGLDYTIQNMIDVPGEGWFVVESITGVYHKGDGWVTDDDMDFYFKAVRPATDEDRKLL